jgi:hypothetical protein
MNVILEGVLDGGSGGVEIHDDGDGIICLGNIVAESGIVIRNHDYGEETPSITDVGNIQAGKRVRIENHGGGNRTSFGPIRAGGYVSIVTGGGGGGGTVRIGSATVEGSFVVRNGNAEKKKKKKSKKDKKSKKEKKKQKTCENEN